MESDITRLAPTPAALSLRNDTGIAGDPNAFKEKLPAATTPIAVEQGDDVRVTLSLSDAEKVQDITRTEIYGRVEYRLRSQSEESATFETANVGPPPAGTTPLPASGIAPSEDSAQFDGTSGSSEADGGPAAAQRTADALPDGPNAQADESPDDGANQRATQRYAEQSYDRDDNRGPGNLITETV